VLDAEGGSALQLLADGVGQNRDGAGVAAAGNDDYSEHELVLVRWWHQRENTGHDSIVSAAMQAAWLLDSSNDARARTSHSTWSAGCRGSCRGRGRAVDGGAVAFRLSPFLFPVDDGYEKCCGAKNGAHLRATDSAESITRTFFFSHTRRLTCEKRRKGPRLACSRNSQPTNQPANPAHKQTAKQTAAL
jgi:hypothetical protein